jgi:hypothetical protein
MQFKAFRDAGRGIAPTDVAHRPARAQTSITREICGLTPPLGETIHGIDLDAASRVDRGQSLNGHRRSRRSSRSPAVRE